MLNRISLKNFKLHETTAIDLPRLTVLIGPNNTGKSSLLQAVLALRQAVERNGQEFLKSLPRGGEAPYIYPDSVSIDIGEFADVVRAGQSTVEISLVGSTAVPEVQESVCVELSASILNNAFDVVRTKLTLAKSGDQILCEWTPHAPRVTPDVFLHEGISFALSAQLFRFGATARTKAEPWQVQKASRAVSNLSAATQRLLDSVHPVHPLRGLEEWAYPIAPRTPGNLERLVLADRSVALASRLAYDRRRLNQVSAWLKEILEVGVDIELIPPSRVAIRTRGKNTLFSSEGMGVNQLPFILLPIGLAEAESTVFVCEPEAHLHPKAQSSLVSLLMRVLEKEPRQMIIETHSEHILHALLLRLARGELRREDLSIYYFEAEDGVARVRRLEIDEKGRIPGGLPGFFEQSLQQLADSLEALRNG